MNQMNMGIPSTSLTFKNFDLIYIRMKNLDLIYISMKNVDLIYINMRNNYTFLGY